METTAHFITQSDSRPRCHRESTYSTPQTFKKLMKDHAKRLQYRSCSDVSSKAVRVRGIAKTTSRGSAAEIAPGNESRKCRRQLVPVVLGRGSRPLAPLKTGAMFSGLPQGYRGFSEHVPGQAIEIFVVRA